MRAARSASLNGARSAGSVRSGSDIRWDLPVDYQAKCFIGQRFTRLWALDSGLWALSCDYHLALMPIIECVPNVSEGRRADVVDGLVRTLRSVPGVRVLDASSDPAHNRSVFTMAGDS